MATSVGVSGHDRVRRSERDIVTAYDARGSALARTNARDRRLSWGLWPERRLGGDLVSSVSLRQREWDRAKSDEQKKITRTSDKVRFDTGVNLLFHGGVLVGGSDFSTCKVIFASAAFALHTQRQSDLRDQIQREVVNRFIQFQKGRQLSFARITECFP
jgi:hypothetical protein